MISKLSIQGVEFFGALSTQRKLQSLRETEFGSSEVNFAAKFFACTKNQQKKKIKLFQKTCKMTNSDDNFERVSRYAKKISNSELDREKRFRAIDQLRDFIKEQLRAVVFKVIWVEVLF